ncbi:MAG TPA: hypothetical protein VM165_24720 [Planctomycetaceae bacterium]|nr:hypothetical protein [Planctomycetaceae bacterium]
MQPIRLRVTNIAERTNGDRSVHLILDGPDGTGEMQNIRFAQCDRGLATPLENLDVGAAEIDRWRADHNGTFVTSDFLREKMMSAPALPHALSATTSVRQNTERMA